MSGKERDTEADGVIQLRLEVSDKCPKDVKGTTYGQKRTVTYRCVLNDMTPADYAGHLMHEYCHYLKFTHRKKYNKRRKYTVPYAVGYLVRDLCSIVTLNLSNNEINNIITLKNEKNI